MNHIRTRSARLGIVAVIVLVVALALPSATFAITRDQAIGRGAAWVKLNVPYSQSRYATVEGSVLPTSTVSPSKLGYRTDCSGFVSMCLGLKRADGTPLSLSTSTLPTVLIPITKDQLRPGDVILKPGHTMLFVAWTSPLKTSFISYEERGTAYGTQSVLRYWDWAQSSGYGAYRYPPILEQRTRKSRVKRSLVTAAAAR